MKKEYAVYKGDKFLFLGTIKECAKFFNVKVRTVYFWASPANKKRVDTGIYPNCIRKKKTKNNAKIAIRIQEDEDE